MYIKGRAQGQGLGQGQGQGQSQRWKSNVWHLAVNNRDPACRVQQKAITLRFEQGDFRRTITSQWTLSVCL